MHTYTQFSKFTFSFFKKDKKKNADNNKYYLADPLKQGARLLNTVNYK